MYIVRKQHFFKRFLSSFVVTEQHGAIFSVQINRPKVKNAVNKETATQLREAFRQFESDNGSRVAILSGSSGTFCAGYDLGEVSKYDEKDATDIFLGEDAPMGPMRHSFNKPIIGAISGYAVGGGLELALLCDMRVMEEDAIMGFFNRRFGVPLTDGGTVRLSKLIGYSRAIDLILTGRSVNSDEALNIGLANRVVSKDRQSAYHAMYNASSVDDALEFEKKNTADCLTQAVKGAGKFAAGAGRSGNFEDYNN